MPPINSKESRKAARETKVIPGPRSLHRGLHIHQNVAAAKQYHANASGTRSDHRDLLVHHQKINEELQDLYARTAALHKDNMTMEERIEQSWKAAERIGVRRPKPKVGFAEHLRSVSSSKKEARGRMEEERLTSGEWTDYSRGSALHDAKDRRIRNFQKRQLKRAHTLRRMGDPTPMKQSGRYDMSSGTLTVFNKTIRRVKRDVRNDDRIADVKPRRGRRSMWDLRGDEANINAPSRPLVRQARELDIGGEGRPRKKRRR